MGILNKLAYFSVFLSVGSILPLSYVWLMQGSVLKIQTIQIKTGQHAKAEELQLYLKEFIGQPLYGVDLRLIKLTAEKHPWVASASVRRQPPYEIELDILERRAVALMKKNKLFVVDSLGVSFKAAQSELELALPVISEVKEIEIILTYEHAKNPAGKLLEIQPYGLNQHRVLLQNGLEVILGSRDYASQWKKLAKIMDKFQNKKEKLAFVYLDDTPNRGQIAVRFK